MTDLDTTTNCPWPVDREGDGLLPTGGRCQDQRWGGASLRRGYRRWAGPLGVGPVGGRTGAGFRVGLLAEGAGPAGGAEPAVVPKAPSPLPARLELMGGPARALGGLRKSDPVRMRPRRTRAVTLTWRAAGRFSDLEQSLGVGILRAPTTRAGESDTDRQLVSEQSGNFVN